MDLMERCYSVLVVSASEKFNQSVTALLSDPRYLAPVIAKDAADAGRKLLEKSYDIVLINTPLPDDFGTDLAFNTAQSSTSAVILFVKAAIYNDIEAKAEACGVLAISKPSNGQLILQSIRAVCVAGQRLKRMEQKTASVEEKIEEIRIVNRAKWLLIEQLKMTEQEAHRYIEKQAMDRCVTKRNVAEKILATYK